VCIRVGGEGPTSILSNLIELDRPLLQFTLESVFLMCHAP